VAFQITKDLTMSDKTVKGINRRELIMASIATVGAAAARAANAASAKAQGASPPLPVRRHQGRSIQAM
jgi:hypothetical protein